MSYFQGQVTDDIKGHLGRDAYEFYLCGKHEMIRDATLLVDVHFSKSHVHTEIFY